MDEREPFQAAGGTSMTAGLLWEATALTLCRAVTPRRKTSRNVVGATKYAPRHEYPRLRLGSV